MERLLICSLRIHVYIYSIVNLYLQELEGVRVYKEEGHLKLRVEVLIF